MSLQDRAFANSCGFNRLARRFHAARRGNIAIMTAFLMMPIMGLMGLAVDYGNALYVKSRLDQAAQASASAAAATARNYMQAQNRNESDYDQRAKDLAAVSEGNFVGGRIFGAQFGTLKNGTADPPTVSVNRVGNTFTATVTYSARLNTYFARMFGVPVFNLAGKRSMIVGMVDAPTPALSTTPNNVIDEQWNAPSTSVQFSDSTRPVINDWYSGTAGSASPISPTGGGLRKGVPTTPLFSNYIQVGGRLSGAAVAPIISKKVYLQAGTYELRYWYKSTTVYPEYEPIYICGSVGLEVRWAVSTVWRDGASSSTTASSNATAQSSRAGVYLDPILGNPQLATTAPAFNSFNVPPAAPSTSNNEIDICVYSSRWIQRSIPLQITASGYFWLSYVAEVPNEINPVRPDSAGVKALATVTNGTTQNGFYLGPVQLCQTACSGLVNDNSPWTVGTMLFSDTFNTPAASNGDRFNVSSGSTSAASGYEVQLPYFFADSDSDNVLSNTWVYENVPGQQRARATVAKSALVRRLYLLPGVYRVTYEAQDGQIANGLTCDFGRSGTIGNTMVRADYNVDRAGIRTQSPPGFNSAGTLNTSTNCSTFRSNSACIQIATTHPYDFLLSTSNVITDPSPFSGISVRQLSIEVLWTNIRNPLSPLSPLSDADRNARCVSQTVNNGIVVSSSVSVTTIAYASMWPGYTTSTLNRVTVTAPYP